MAQVRLVTMDDLTWGQIPGTTGGVAQIGEVIGSEDSDTIGAGFTRLEHTSMSRELEYDEVVLVLEGTMVVESGGDVLEARQGQALHIPKGAKTTYRFTEPTLLFYAIYPNNWQDLI
mgnify:CR=1 FL=1